MTADNGTNFQTQDKVVESGVKIINDSSDRELGELPLSWVSEGLRGRGAGGSRCRRAAC
jgi:hypothetical protein